jgi:uncharacterized membrane protein YphA (DoxX/SURF4 family)
MTNLASSAPSTRGRTIAYWVTTVLVAAESVLGGVWDIRQIPYVRTDIDKLGYPAYVLVIIGVWKLLGAVAVLVPRFPRLKEWAYAGMFFNYTGAVASHLAVGDGAESVAYPIIITGLVVASWALRPSARRDLAPSIPRRG